VIQIELQGSHGIYSVAAVLYLWVGSGLAGIALGFPNSSVLQIKKDRCAHFSLKERDLLRKSLFYLSVILLELELRASLLFFQHYGIFNTAILLIR